ncbi:MAG: ATP-binding protein [Nanoarchaeota archaeon]|nr:ATP-binding protein [Nanoarchaeota archaeon]
MKYELFKQNPWWDKQFSEQSIIREHYLNKLIDNLNNKEIIFVTGLRRIGKTTLLRQLISHLLKTTVPDDILFLSLDSFPLMEYSIHDVVEEYRKIKKKKTSDFFFLILDEVTTKENFESELKSLYDNDNLKMFCSSSIATFLRDKKARLTGRTKTIELMPLSFKEFIQFKKEKIGASDKSLLESLFEDYLKTGGIPRYVLTKDRDYLNEMVESIIYKDIISYYNITSERTIKELFILLCRRVGKPLSYNKISNILSISVDSAKRYIGYFEKSYLFFVIDRFSKSPNESVTSPKKIYAGDVGILNLVTEEKELGASFENIVFLKIKDKNPKYLSENLTEIDFIIKDHLIEAKYNSEMNKKQKALFDSIRIKNKIIADSPEFFLKDLV